jgi:hypothetical protein
MQMQYEVNSELENRFTQDYERELLSRINKVSANMAKKGLSLEKVYEVLSTRFPEVVCVITKREGILTIDVGHHVKHKFAHAEMETGIRWGK